jgi:molybdopterin-binding protein
MALSHTATDAIEQPIAFGGLDRVLARGTYNRSLALPGCHRRLTISRSGSMKLSARNQIPGKVVAVQKGQTTAHVRIDIGYGVIVTSSITNEAVDDLGLKVGDEALAVIKASDVMVAKQ